MGSWTEVSAAVGSDLFACPVCGTALCFSGEEPGACCSDCGRGYACDGGIPRLFWPEEPVPAGDVTDIVKSFYEETPFPDYEERDSAASLREKAGRGAFASQIDAQIPDQARVLEVGCGTGQLSNFLALAPGRMVVGTDMCLNSLGLAQGFKARNGIDNVTFAQMNLFRPALRPEGFDFVLCNGVLHHTSDPFRGFECLCRLARPGGFVVLGLYNTLGRLPTLFRRALVRVGGGRLAFLDPRLRSDQVGSTRKRSWFKDQYCHPHESRHSFNEVGRWFEECGIEFIGSIPSTRVFEPFRADARLFDPSPRGSAIEQKLVELGMLLTGGGDGGLFVVIGGKPM